MLVFILFFQRNKSVSKVERDCFPIGIDYEEAATGFICCLK